MGTRANIFIKQDDKLHGIYCHCGDPTQVADTLLTY